MTLPSILPIPIILLVAADAGLLRSENAGQTWSVLYTAKCWDLEIKPNDPTVVYLLKNNSAQKRCEFFKSSDFGASFSIRESGWYTSNNTDRRDDGARMTVTPADANAIYVVLAGDSKPGDNGFIGVLQEYRRRRNLERCQIPRSADLIRRVTPI